MDGSVRSLEAILARLPTWPHYGEPLHLSLHGPPVTHPRHTTCQLRTQRHTTCQGRDTTALSVLSPSLSHQSINHHPSSLIDAQANDTAVAPAKAYAEATHATVESAAVLAAHRPSSSLQWPAALLLTTFLLGIALLNRVSRAENTFESVRISLVRPVLANCRFYPTVICSNIPLFDYMIQPYMGMTLYPYMGRHLPFYRYICTLTCVYTHICT